MTKAKQTSGEVFHGWWVVLVAGVGLSLSYGPIIVTTFGVFLKPLSQEFGWSRAEASGNHTGSLCPHCFSTDERPLARRAPLRVRKSTFASERAGTSLCGYFSGP